MSGEWQTPLWLVKKCRAALGGYITLDAATSASNNVGALVGITAEDDALGPKPWLEYASARGYPGSEPTLFLNPPGEKSGKLIRLFWERYNNERADFYSSIWVDFNLDHLRFIKPARHRRLFVPAKRLAFTDPATGLERKGAQIGGFLVCDGHVYPSELDIAGSWW
jgi:hypothetical protein